jgi:hypothetical protein
MRLATYSQRRRLKHRGKRPRPGGAISSSREYSCSLPRAYQTQRSTDFFKNAHDFEIYGGQFILMNSSVDHSEVLNKIRQDVRHIKVIVVVLFVSAGHLRT